jgi:hypothetical protein
MEEMERDEYKVTVRFVEDFKSGSCWFEEKISNHQWVMIPDKIWRNGLNAGENNIYQFIEKPEKKKYIPSTEQYENY